MRAMIAFIKVMWVCNIIYSGIKTVMLQYRHRDTHSDLNAHS